MTNESAKYSESIMINEYIVHNENSETNDINKSYFLLKARNEIGSLLRVSVFFSVCQQNQSKSFLFSRVKPKLLKVFVRY